MMAALIGFSTFAGSGAPVDSVYHPARYENGELVPGGFSPPEPPVADVADDD